MAEINCDRIDCERLRRFSLGGIPDSELLSRGIQPGSRRARDLQNTLDDLLAHCCATNLGPPPEEQPPRPLQAGVGAAAVAAAVPEESALAVLLRRFWPIALLAIVEAVASATQHEKCLLVRTRFLRNVSGVECMYLCLGANRLHYRTSRNPMYVCSPFIYMPA